MTTGPVYDPGGDWTLPGPDGVRVPGSYGGGDGGGGFEYDEETLRELVREWRDLAAEFRADIAQAEKLGRVQGPGIEYASSGNAELVRASGSALTKTLRQRADYCDAMADRFVTALGKYAEAEETHAGQIADTTKGIL
ncbi:hypothetical protein [Amycolatopsis sp. NPDC004625]|uniref:hypothetical protein n=1 Tax=Amycolatopsis sp. NPDC004625 TaxID=3154670 RepID=UPI0033ACB2FF